MDPFPLTTSRFLLDQPVPSDVADIARYCAEPVFERFMVTPWPYERAHAEGFVDAYAPDGWAEDREWTWAIRAQAGAPLLGVVGVRMDSGMVGYWLGAEHRGRGVLPEALAAVIGAVFDRSERDDVLWECRVGNVASLRVAQKCGFRYTGEREGIVPSRDGSRAQAWTGRLHCSDDRGEKPGWPDE